MSNYFLEFNVDNFVQVADQLLRLRHKYKDSVNDNEYTDITDTLQVVDAIQNKIGSTTVKITKLKNSIPYKKHGKSFVVVPLTRVKDAFCFYNNNEKIQRCRFVKPTLINGEAMWGCPANDSDVWLLVLESDNSFDALKNMLQ